ncbi:hypothetical protein QQP08_001654, partial [Theobroma cacao]
KKVTFAWNKNQTIPSAKIHPLVVTLHQHSNILGKIGLSQHSFQSLAGHLIGFIRVRPLQPLNRGQVGVVQTGDFLVGVARLNLVLEHVAKEFTVDAVTREGHVDPGKSFEPIFAFHLLVEIQDGIGHAFWYKLGMQNLGYEGYVCVFPSVLFHIEESRVGSALAPNRRPNLRNGSQKVQLSRLITGLMMKSSGWKR